MGEGKKTGEKCAIIINCVGRKPGNRVIQPNLSIGYYDKFGFLLLWSVSVSPTESVRDSARIVDQKGEELIRTGVCNSIHYEKKTKRLLFRK